jgi:hypothetical protein
MTATMKKLTASIEGKTLVVASTQGNQGARRANPEMGRGPGEAPTLPPLRVALYQQTRAVAEAVARLIELGAEYRRTASGRGGEPKRADEALLALEQAKGELMKAVDCFEHPEGGGR